MSATIDYQKYENMSKRNLFNALLSAEKKYETLKENLEQKLNAQAQLVEFLKAKIKTQLEKSENYALSEAPSMQKIRKDFKTLSSSEQEQIKSEVYAECGINANSF